MLAEVDSIQIYPQLSLEGSFLALAPGFSLHLSFPPYETQVPLALCSLRCGTKACSRSKPTDQHCRKKGSSLAWIKITEKILASFVRPINADGEKPAWYLRDRKPPHRLAALFRAPPGSCRRHPAGTHHCAGGCAWRAAARSRGSSSAPTRTGTCTPPSRSVRPPPHCWSTSGTPAWESVGEILSTSAFIHENRARRVAGPFPCYSTWFGADTLWELWFFRKAIFPICKTKWLYLNC